MSDKVDVLMIRTGIGTGSSWSYLCFCNPVGFDSVEEMILNFSGCIKHGIEEENGREFICCDKWSEIEDNSKYCSNCGTKVSRVFVEQEEIECFISDLVKAETADCMTQEIWEELYQSGWSVIGDGHIDYRYLKGTVILPEGGECIISEAAMNKKLVRENTILTTNDTPMHKK